VRRAALLAAAAAAALAGCGGQAEPGSTPTIRTESPALPTSTPTPAPEESPQATAPSAPAPPPDAGVAQGHGAEEEQEGGAGDEEAARTPVSVVVDAEGMTPPRVVVPAFIALRVTVRNDLPRAIRVRGLGVRLRVPARSRRSVDAGGVKRGRYELDAGAAGDAVVEAE